MTMNTATQEPIPVLLLNPRQAKPDRMTKVVFSLDPGSRRSGWAVFTQAGQLVQAGVLTPDKTRHCPPLRIGRMCDDLRRLLDEYEPAEVLIEWASGHVGRRRHKGKGAGLAIYGAAVGALWQTVVAWADGRATAVRCINENTWTNGVPKQARIVWLSQSFAEYAPEKDPGGDVGDAIGLALWWLKERAVVPF